MDITTPKNRKLIYDKYGGRCAYCGKLLKTRWHVDHIHPMRRGDDPVFRPLWLHKIENLNPSCPSCNISKSVFSLETWRGEIEKKVGRMNNTSVNYRILKRMRLIRETGVPVVFYFEKLNDVKNNL